MENNIPVIAQIIAVEVARDYIKDDESRFKQALTQAIETLKSVDYSNKTPQELTAINHADLREIAHYFGGWDVLRLVITELEEADNEAAAERYYSKY